MNAVQKALVDIKFSIPPEILTIAFQEMNQQLNSMLSLDDRILSAVIRPRVMVDCNLVGGIETRVDLNMCSISYLSNREFIAEVPKELTNGASIITVLSLVSNVIYTRSTNYNEMPGALSASMNMMNNLNTETVVQTSRLELIADNVVLIEDPTIHLVNGILRCVVENSPNMENINPRSYNAFSKLCILAVKSYIYNSTIVKLDKGYVYGGHDLGIIKDIIDNYSSAEEEYQEYLNTIWREVAFINNGDQMARFVKSMIGNTI